MQPQAFEIMVRKLHLVAILFIASSLIHAQSIAEQLGFKADAKLLIIHADDLGVAHSENRASFDAFSKGMVNSASIMVPCPWFMEVVNWALANPKADLGLHLTLTAEWKHLKWGPVAGAGAVPGLVDEQG